MKRVLNCIFFYHTILVIFSFVFLLLFSYSTSPLYLLEGCDNTVFKTMGLAICNGKVPYVDIFDHKGPIFYLIQTIAESISLNRWGLFAIQFISLSISVVVWHKIANIYLSPKKSTFSVLLMFFMYFYLIEGGILPKNILCCLFLYRYTLFYKFYCRRIQIN